jgi:hypothetical protein
MLINKKTTGTGGRKQSRNTHLYTLWLRTDHVTWFCDSWVPWVLTLLRCSEVVVCLYQLYSTCDTNKQQLNINFHRPTTSRQQQQRRSTVMKEDGDDGRLWRGDEWGSRPCLEPQVRFFCSFLFPTNIFYRYTSGATNNDTARRRRDTDPTLATNARRWAVITSQQHPRNPMQPPHYLDMSPSNNNSRPHPRSKHELVGSFIIV